MRFARPLTALVAFSLVVSFTGTGTPAHAQTAAEAEDQAEEAKQRADSADGLVDEAVANREEIERQLADSIARMNELAEQEYLAALSALEVAQAVEAERQRQERRPGAGSTTTTGGSTTTDPPSNPQPQNTTTTSQPPTTASTGGGGGGGPWNHPPHIEQWRGLVSQYFPSSRVDEALAIIDCESNGDPNALNPYSGASGLFQFLPSTWASTAPKAGFAGASVFDAEANIGSAAWLGNRYEDLGYYFWHPWSCRRVLD